MNIYESKIKCPTKSKYNAVIICQLKSDILINGYLRECAVTKMIPFEICKLIDNWYYDDYIYLYPINLKDHWCISIDVIFNGFK